jgi:predicted DNA-binding transcriptional regulator AlpA
MLRRLSKYAYIHVISMKPLKPNEKLLSGPSVAKFWDLDPATIRRWRREGAPFHVLGSGLIRYRLSELEQWRASRNAHKSSVGAK